MGDGCAKARFPAREPLESSRGKRRFSHGPRKSKTRSDGPNVSLSSTRSTHHIHPLRRLSGAHPLPPTGPRYSSHQSQHNHLGINTLEWPCPPLDIESQNRASRHFGCLHPGQWPHDPLFSDGENKNGESE